MMLHLHYEGPDSGVAGLVKTLGKTAELCTVLGFEVWIVDLSYVEVFVLRTKKCWFQRPPSRMCCSAIRKTGCEGL